MKTVALWLLLATGSNTYAQEVPPFANVTGVEFKGSGCDAESARVSITEDLQYMSILYDRFSAETGNGVGISNRTANRNCSVVVKFDLPAGWTMQFDQVEYHGFVALPNAKSVAHQTISVSSSFLGKFKDFQKNEIRGPKMDNFTTVYKNQVQAAIIQAQQKREAIAGSMKNSKIGFILANKAKKMRKDDLIDCSDRLQNASIKIQSKISVANLGDRTMAKIVVDSTDASFSQKLKISWNKCLID